MPTFPRVPRPVAPAEDLEGLDTLMVQALTRMRHIEREGVDADAFADVVFETFTTLSADGRIVELMPGGADVDVTFECGPRRLPPPFPPPRNPIG